MYQFSYAEIAQESFASARHRERDAFDRSIEALRKAEIAGPQTREAIEAIHLTRSLWSILVEDLASAENQLPEDLRGSLISIGLWVMRETDAIRLGRQTSFAALIDITTSIRDGLEG